MNYPLNSIAPNVLVLLATHNGALWIDEQVNSIIKQKDVVVHVLARDDCSNDGTLSILKNYSVNFSNFRVVNASFASGSAGANFKELIMACDLSHIDYVAFSDQDDIWYETKLIDAIRSLASGNYGGYSSAVVAGWKNSTKKKMVAQSPRIMDADFLFEGAGQGCTFLIPVNIFNLIIKFIKENSQKLELFYYHDWLVYLLVRSWGFSWYFDKRPSIFYRQHQNNDTGSRGSLQAITKRLSLIKNGWYKNQVKLAIKIYILSSDKYSKKLKLFFMIFNKHDSFSRKVLVAFFILLYGRRRISDRVFLFFSALVGWI
ncbi:glycosyltransferase [Polynucleobacter sp. AP-Reno-20A-A9]|uniref:glycosyltransferase n=1 Tax=Polynucleobacter sp. AP-Reno-20A-A9 TaxID=2576925 RepID=UPI001C0ADFDF|nr:glycosyltransferase [Polynucleobacter sp. AP-Reno-20A-A9]MBU3629311.1 glycosyltransferase [Polynucleobacter sp. AP-Reno-20A-A9]